VPRPQGAGYRADDARLLAGAYDGVEGGDPCAPVSTYSRLFSQSLIHKKNHYFYFLQCIRAAVRKICPDTTFESYTHK
jgi:hypothetical protein